MSGIDEVWRVVRVYLVWFGGKFDGKFCDSNIMEYLVWAFVYVTKHRLLSSRG